VALAALHQVLLVQIVAVGPPDDRLPRRLVRRMHHDHTAAEAERRLGDVKPDQALGADLPVRHDERVDERVAEGRFRLGVHAADRPAGMRPRPTGGSRAEEEQEANE